MRPPIVLKRFVYATSSSEIAGKSNAGVVNVISIICYFKLFPERGQSVGDWLFADQPHWRDYIFPFDVQIKSLSPQTKQAAGRIETITGAHGPATLACQNALMCAFVFGITR